MDVLLNELSLRGQFVSREDFLDSLKDTVKVIEKLDSSQSIKWYKSRKLDNVCVTSTGDTFHSLLDLSRKYPQIRRFKSLLFEYNFIDWEDAKTHNSTVVYKYKEENVGGTSLAETCEREKLIVSFQHANYASILLEILKGIDEQIKEVHNFYNLSTFDLVSRHCGWTIPFSLKNNPRFEKVHMKRLTGVPVYKEIATRRYWYLDSLHGNHYEIFDAGGNHIGEADLEGNVDTSKRVNGRTIKL